MNAPSSTEIFTALRRKIKEAVDIGALSSGSVELIQGTLLQLLSECERQRQSHEAAAARLMEQYHRELGQRDGLTAMSSMVQDLIHAQILRAQRDVAQQTEYAAEIAAKREAATARRFEKPKKAKRVR